MTQTTIGNCLHVYLKHNAVLSALLDQESLPSELKEEEGTLAAFAERSREQAVAVLEGVFSSVIEAHGIGKYRWNRRSQRRTVRDTRAMEGRIFRRHERSASTHWHLALGCLRDKGPALTFVITPQDPGAPEALDKFAALLATEMNLDSANARDCFGPEGIFECGVVAAAVPLQPTAKHSEISASLAKQLNEFFAKHGDKLEQALNACAG